MQISNQKYHGRVKVNIREFHPRAFLLNSSNSYQNIFEKVSSNNEVITCSAVRTLIVKQSWRNLSAGA